VSRLHICHISSVHSTTDTRVFYRECMSLAEKHRVTLIAIGNESGNIHGVEVIALSKPRNRMFRLLFTTFKVFWEAKKQQADVYHFHDPELIPYALLLKSQGKQVVFDIHENITESMKAKKWLPVKWFFIYVYLLFDKLAARYFHLILAEDAYRAVYSRRYPNKQLTIVRNFAPTRMLLPFRQHQRSQLPMHIFYMGSLDELYCIEPMLHAIFLLKEKGYKPLLKMVGWLSSDVKTRIGKLPYFNQIQENLAFYGYQDISVGYSFSLDCSMGFSFVSNNVNVRESLPRKMFEYMQIGLPVISSGYETYRSLVEANRIGVCIDSCTGENIADAAIKLMQDKKGLDRLVLNNIKAATDIYNWEKESSILIDFYDNLIKK
jgi:glycosyltransferase involved in cell wall biosynthesis